MGNPSMSLATIFKETEAAKAPKRSKVPRVRAPIKEERTRSDGTTWIYSPPMYKKGKVVVEKPRALHDVPQDRLEQNNLGTELIEWARHEEAEAIEQFPLLKSFNPYRFYDIARDNPYFADCLDAAMSAIGFRRERNARTRKEDSTTIMKMQPLYNKQFRALSMEKSSAEATKVGTVIQVIESKVPESDMVPRRISE